MIKDSKMLDIIILVECDNASENIDNYTANIKRLMFSLCDR